jgi:hypothetical protein
MAHSQVPWGVDALSGTVSDPAWRSKPSWYLIVTDDQMIPSPLHRTMEERPARQPPRCPAATPSTSPSPPPSPTSSPKRASPRRL